MARGEHRNIQMHGPAVHVVFQYNAAHHIGDTKPVSYTHLPVGTPSGSAIGD